jgi:hypothetical protein
MGSSIFGSIPSLCSPFGYILTIRSVLVNQEGHSKGHRVNTPKPGAR